MIRAADARDAESIASIYNHYIEHTTVTFEEQPLAAAEVAQRIATVVAGHPWLVFERDAKVLGYAYGARFHARSAYRYTAEATVYVAPDACGGGIGTALYRELLDRLRMQHLHRVVGIIALPNDASVRLHERFGFVRVAHLQEVGWKLERWIDVGFWQLAL